MYYTKSRFAFKAYRKLPEVRKYMNVNDFNYTTRYTMITLLLLLIIGLWSLFLFFSNLMQTSGFYIPTSEIEVIKAYSQYEDVKYGFTTKVDGSKLVSIAEESSTDLVHEEYVDKTQDYNLFVRAIEGKSATSFALISEGLDLSELPNNISRVYGAIFETGTKYDKLRLGLDSYYVPEGLVKSLSNSSILEYHGANHLLLGVKVGDSFSYSLFDEVNTVNMLNNPNYVLFNVTPQSALLILLIFSMVFSYLLLFLIFFTQREGVKLLNSFIDEGLMTEDIIASLEAKGVRNVKSSLLMYPSANIKQRKSKE